MRKISSFAGRLRAAIVGGALLAALVPVAVPSAAAEPLAVSSEQVLATVASNGAVTVMWPGSTVAQSAFVCLTRPSGWANALPPSSWIGPVAECNSNLPVGAFTYTTTFSLPSDVSAHHDLRLSGSILVDDTATLYLNGHQFATAAGTGGASSFATTERSWFLGGVNTLIIAVNNQVGPTGLDYYATVTARVESAPVPPDRHDHPDGRGHNADKDECKDGGWHDLGYRNQGQCVSDAARGERGA